MTVLFDVGEDDQRDPSVDQVAAAVARTGVQTNLFGIRDDLDAMAEGLRRMRPDLVVNLVRRFAFNPKLAPDVAAALELLDIPYTGAGPGGLYLLDDPPLARRLLAGHGVEVTVDGDPPGTDALLGVIGGERVEIALGPLHAASTEEPGVSEDDWIAQREALLGVARATQSALRLRDYSLLAVRLLASGGAAVVSAIPNPLLARDGDLARIFLRAGWGYEDVIQRVLHEAWTRSEVERRLPHAP